MVPMQRGARINRAGRIALGQATHGTHSVS
jgi:hypothetical protein